MNWELTLTIISLLGFLFFLSVLYALSWSAKKGHFKNFEAQARSIFDEQEPEGIQTDFFPGHSSK